MLVPTVPVIWESPVWLTAQLLEKSTKLAVVPRVGACAKPDREIRSITAAEIRNFSSVFIIIIEWVEQFQPVLKIDLSLRDTLIN
jgi:hypothetical protein